MTNQLLVPQDEETILVEMTDKEALALSGEKFNQNQQLEISAMKKVKSSLAKRLLKEAK